MEKTNQLQKTTNNMQMTNELQAAYTRANQLQEELDQSQMNLADYNIKISNF